MTYQGFLYYSLGCVLYFAVEYAIYRFKRYRKEKKACLKKQSPSW